MPLITDLKNPAMRERHWAQIKTEVGRDIELAVECCLDPVALGEVLQCDFVFSYTLTGEQLFPFYFRKVFVTLSAFID